MSVTVRVPTTLRTLTDGRAELSVEPGTVRRVLESLDSRYSGFASRVLDGDGSVRRFVNLYVDEEDVRFLKGLDTKIPEGSTLAIIPAVAGGQASFF